MIDDFGLIVSSFRAQYGIRLKTECEDMTWDEFYDLLSGLDADTPLGKIIQIRTETDKDMLENFTSGQRQIRSEWQRRVARNRSEDETMSFVLAMQQALKNMSVNGG